MVQGTQKAELGRTYRAKREVEEGQWRAQPGEVTLASHPWCRCGDLKDEAADTRRQNVAGPEQMSSLAVAVEVRSILLAAVENPETVDLVLNTLNLREERAHNVEDKLQADGLD
jgi:hypothetical protein